MMREYRSKLTFVWQYLSKTLGEFKAAVLGYRSYEAYIDQTLTNDPTALVLSNNTGLTISWRRQSDGNYYGKISSGVLDRDKTFFVNILSYDSNVYFVYSSVLTDQSQDNIIINTYDNSTLNADLNGRLYFEMRIYNK
jgi:hypothetical protein